VFIELGDWRRLFPGKNEEPEEGELRLQQYCDDFERRFIELTGEYYARESARWIEEASTPEYLKMVWEGGGGGTNRWEVEDRLAEESTRVGAYLHAATEEKLLKELEKQLLAQQQMKLLEKEGSGLATLLRDQRVQGPPTPLSPTP
jgi:hypothetical protein